MLYSCCPYLQFDKTWWIVIAIETEWNINNKNQKFSLSKKSDTLWIDCVRVISRLSLCVNCVCVFLCNTVLLYACPQCVARVCIVNIRIKKVKNPILIGSTMNLNRIRHTLISAAKHTLHHKRNRSYVATNALDARHLQEAALAENCILVNENDEAVGLASKRDCHRVNNDGRVKLHRAFSVFLFNSEGDMLIQRRASHKVNV